MSFLYKLLDKKVLAIRNDIFVKHGIPFLEKNGFKRSPFSTALFGKNNVGGYSYELCRLDDAYLQYVTTHISKKDKYIKIHINIFCLHPTPNSLDQMKGIKGTKFGIRPNNCTEMRLRIDDTVAPPIFRILFGKEHKLGIYYSETGLKRRIKELGILIENDLSNIDHFVKRWFEIHRNPIKTTWDGSPI